METGSEGIPDQMTPRNNPHDNNNDCFPNNILTNNIDALMPSNMELETVDGTTGPHNSENPGNDTTPQRNLVQNIDTENSVESDSWIDDLFNQAHNSLTEYAASNCVYSLQPDETKCL